MTLADAGVSKFTELNHNDTFCKSSQMQQARSRMTLHIQLADLDNVDDQAAIVTLLDHYSQHEMGSGRPLPDDVKSRLIDGLRAHPMSRIFIARSTVTNVAMPVGLAVCFVGFSTFKAKPLVNIHDLVVHESCRGQGIGGQLIDAVADYSKQLGGCAVTLEVRADNPARKLYAKKGFQTLGEPMASDVSLFGKLVLS